MRRRSSSAASARPTSSSPAWAGVAFSQARARWRVAEMRPGQDPFGALADALLRPEAIQSEWSAPFPDPAEARAFLLAALRRGPLGLAEGQGSYEGQGSGLVFCA